MKSDGKYYRNDADDETLMPAQVIALENIPYNSTGSVLHLGYLTNTGWSWTKGGLIYVSLTSGGLTQTLVSGSGDQAQIVGYATGVQEIYFNPCPVLVEIAQ